MKIQILGAGCDKCNRLAANVLAAKTKFALDCEVEKITDIGQITSFGAFSMPALVVDGKIVCEGKAPSVDDIASLLSAPKGCACKTGKGTDPDSQNSCCCSSGSGSCDCDCSSGSQGQNCCCTPAAKSTGCGSRNFWKQLLTLMLLAFIACSIAFIIGREIERGAEKPKNPPAFSTETQTKNPDALIVYYFHRTKRCPACNTIESLTRTAVTNKYSKELSQGSVVFKSLNLDIPENEQAIKAFELASGTVVLQRNGKYEKLDKVWTLVRTPDKLVEYIQDRIATQLKDPK